MESGSEGAGLPGAATERLSTGAPCVCGLCHVLLPGWHPWYFAAALLHTWLQSGRRSLAARQSYTAGSVEGFQLQLEAACMLQQRENT